MSGSDAENLVRRTMYQGLKEKLLKATGAVVGNDDGTAHHERQARRASTFSPGAASRRSKLTEQQIIRRWQDKAEEQPKFNLHRRFLYRLAVALHSYGSSASRTEYLIERAADRLHEKVNIAVFPSLIMLSFSEVDSDESGRNEFHLITVDSDLDVDKLGRADELANNVGKRETPLPVAYWRLKAIATSNSEFGKWWRLLSFALSASMAALLFFDGSIWDAYFSFLLGLLVGMLDKLASKSSRFGNLIEFAAASLVSFAARVLSIHLTHLKICFSSIVLSSLVQLLPGLSLTLGVSEMVAKAHVTGASRIMYALFSALQLGFGISVGESLVWWAKEPVAKECQSTNLPIWWNILWFSGYTVSSNILLNARLDQWPGMALASGAGYVASELAGLHFGSNASSVIAAFAVGIAGTSCSYFIGDLPLVMILSGILLLVPGGIGVQGVAAMLQDDVLSGMGFVFDMVVVGLSITLGLLMAKIVLPAGHHFNAVFNKASLAAQFQDESDEEEEDMAI